VPASGESWDEVSGLARRGYGDIMGRLRLLKMVPVQQGGLIVDWRPFVLKLSPSGREAWVAFTEAHAAEVNGPDFPDHLRGPWSKMRGYCGRLALVVHLLRWGACEAGPEVGDVDGESVARGAALVGYFKGMARRCYAHMNADKRAAPARKIWEWVRKKGLTSFKAWEVCRDLRSEKYFPGIEAVEEPLKLLECHNYVREQAPPHRLGPGRKPAGIWLVNPAAMSRENRVNRAIAPEEDPLIRHSLD
jgi:hypothetical protein